MNSLKDQLFKAGLADAKAAKNTRKQKQPKQKKKLRGGASESSKLAEQAIIDKANRDKQLNLEQQKIKEQKALFAQIKQLVANSKLDREEGELAYNFQFNSKIKTLYVNQEQQKQLTRGQISLVTIADDQFELVPTVVAKKIAERDANYLVQTKIEDTNSSAKDDPYADYQVPDDLMW